MTSAIKIVAHCPYMVAMKQYVRRKLKLCGGTVLTHTLTLTAAHCLVYGITGLHLQFGSVHIFEGRNFQATSLIFQHNFDPVFLDHDLGIVSIAPEKVDFGYAIQPVMLPQRDIYLKPNMFLNIYGWGAISDTKSFSESLRSTVLPVIDRNICQSLLDGKVPENTFCLGYFDGHVDSCLGDSGGPVMLNGVQVGVISFGEGCAQPFKPGVYTDLSPYLNWLHEIMDNYD